VKVSVINSSRVNQFGGSLSCPVFSYVTWHS